MKTLLNNTQTYKKGGTYLSKCDLINKYNVKSLHQIPMLDKIVLEFPLEDFLNACDFSDKDQTDSVLQVKAALIFYILSGSMPYINFNKSTSSIVKSKIVENQYALKIVFSDAESINSFLNSIFIENWSKLLLEDFLLFKPSKTGSKESLSVPKKFVFKTTISGGIFFEIENFLNKNLGRINSKKLKLKVNFFISNALKTTDSNSLIKNLPYFWIS